MTTARRGRGYHRTREAHRLERALAERFGLTGRARIDVRANRLDRPGEWCVEWQDGPSVDQVRAAVAELAGPGLTLTSQRGRLRYVRSVSARSWAVALVAAAVAGELDLDPDRPGAYSLPASAVEATAAAWSERAATREQDAAATELLRLAGAGPDGYASEFDLADLLREHGYAAIVSGAGVIRLRDYTARHGRGKGRPVTTNRTRARCIRLPWQTGRVEL